MSEISVGMRQGHLSAKGGDTVATNVDKRYDRIAGTDYRVQAFRPVKLVKGHYQATYSQRNRDQITSTQTRQCRKSLAVGRS